MTTNETKNSIFGDVIYQYTRAQAIEDGILIDVSGNRPGSGNHLSHRRDGGRLGSVRHRARKRLVARRDGPAVGCADAVAARHRPEAPAASKSTSPWAVQNDEQAPAAGTPQSPLRTGRLGRARHHDHAPRRRLGRQPRRLPRSRRDSGSSRVAALRGQAPGIHANGG